MDQLSLPVLPSDMELGEALEQMRDAGKSGFVTDVGGIPAVIDVESLQTGQMLYNTRIGEIKPVHRSVVLPPALRNDSLDTEYSLDLHDAAFGIGEIVGDEATIFTRHEPYAARLNAPYIYYRCRRNPRHVFAPGTLRIAGRCNVDGSLVDPV